MSTATMIKFKQRPIVRFPGEKNSRPLSVEEFCAVVKLIRIFAGVHKAREWFDRYAEFDNIESV